MNKVKALKYVNIIMAVLFVMVALPGMLQSQFPGIIDYGTFRRVHPLAGNLFVLAAIAHIYLNFNWIKANILKRK
jgi:hypothetical protein